jgi:hypothetical protein
MNASPANLIDGCKYPVTALGSDSGRELIARMRSELDRDGACCLRNFLTDEAVERLADEARSLARFAYPGPREASPYFFNYQSDEAAKLPEDHPRRVKTRRRLGQVASDLIPRDSLLRALYEWEGLATFLAAAMNVERLYRNADRFQALNISVMEPGGCQQWHFDTARCVSTLLLQTPEGGGDFEYVPAIRSEEDEHYDAVGDILRGSRVGVRTITLGAGTLMLFRGHYSLHRVTEVTGKRNRLQSILGFNPKPGIRGSMESNILHYGPRVAELTS